VKRDATYRRDLAVIHAVKTRAIDAGRLTEDGYRAMIAAVQDRLGMDASIAPSSANLPRRGRLMLMDDLRRVAGETRAAGRRSAPRYQVPGRPGWITAAQAGYIARLEDQLGWNDRKRLVGFIQRQTGHQKAVAMLTNRQASDVITGLERLAGIKPHPRSKATRPASR